MKLEIEIEEPRYKIGDVIILLCGKDKEIPIVFAVVNYVEDGEYVIQNNKIHYQPKNSVYWLSCQIDYQNDPLSKWMAKRTFLTVNRESIDNDLSVRQIHWNEKILPAQTEEYLNKKEKVIAEIDRGESSIHKLQSLAVNF